jgi:hypothetical protein
VSINGKIVTITQDGPSCVLTLPAPMLTLSAAGGDFSVAVSGEGCPFSTISSAPWITVREGANGTAPATVTFRAAPNSGGVRTGTVTIGYHTVSVTQEAACTYAVRGHISVDVFGANTGIYISTSPGCSWTAASLSPWVSLTGPSSFSSTGSVSIRVQPNYGLLRMATLVIAARQVFVQQNGFYAEACDYGLNAAQIAAPPTGSIRLADKIVTVSQAGNPRPATERLIQLLYYSFLARLPSEAEIAFHAANSGARSAPANLALSFFNAEEFHRAGRFVAGLYVGILDRDAEFGGWRFQRGALVANLLTPEQMVANFIGSASGLCAPNGQSTAVSCATGYGRHSGQPSNTQLPCLPLTGYAALARDCALRVPGEPSIRTLP